MAGNNEIRFIQSFLKKEYNIESNQIFGICPFGSKTYGTQTKDSDSDYVVIVDMRKDYIQYESKELDIHIMSIDYYKKLLKDHDIMALEVYFNPSPLISFKPTFVLDLIKLRHQISSVSSNSWVKAKKKVSLEHEDSWVGYKSLFHSMRILYFGIQLAKNGKISYYTDMVPLWNDILTMVDEGKDIEEIMAYYKPQYNANKTKFRLLAPKELKVKE